MKRGKAAGLDGITSEHLRFSHCLLSCDLSKLYNFMLRLAHVPHCFGLSYTVPVINKKLSYCWETVRRESMPRIAEIEVEMTT